MTVNDDQYKYSNHIMSMVTSHNTILNITVNTNLHH